MDTVILYLGGIIGIYFIWKSKWSDKTKKILIGLIILALLLNAVPLLTGQKILPLLFGG